jgi:hypothetical protein
MTAPISYDRTAVRTGQVRRRLEFLALPLVYTAALFALSLLPAVARNNRLQWSFWAATAFLTVWHVLLLAAIRQRESTLAIVLAPRKQHYLQACAQGMVLLYWGWYWPEVYASAHLIVAQLLFAYAFDLLLNWSRDRVYMLGFGPFPIVFSINLFLWFKADWFYLQFLMIAVAFTAKEFVRWDRGGRRVHIFNPSAFALAVFSLGLIAAGRSDITWGHEVANTLMYAPQMYLFIFLIGLPGQLLFGVTTMTMAAVVTMYALGLMYFAITGTYFFFDSYIPIAVFLGMHLLFTDPSTSPRTDLGRIVFGAMYALSVVLLYDLLGRAGAPTFYDKLLAVPIMNLTVKLIDRLAASSTLRRLEPTAFATGVVGRMRNVAYVGVWVLVFGMMSAVQAVGDHHPGHWVPFWQRACLENRPDGCRNLGVLLTAHCAAGSGWACNEYGLLLQPDRRPERAKMMFTQACDLGFQTGCANLNLQAGEVPHPAAPTLIDYPILLREGQGRLVGLVPTQIYRRACSQGYVDGCEQSCRIGDSSACSAAARLTVQ